MVEERAPASVRARWLRSERQRASRNPATPGTVSPGLEAQALRAFAPRPAGARTVVEERAPASVSKPGDAGSLVSPGLEAQALRAFAPRPAGAHTVVEERAPASVSKPGDARRLGSPGLEAQALRAFAPRPAGARRWLRSERQRASRNPATPGSLVSPGLEAQALRAFAPRPAGARTVVEERAPASVSKPGDARQPRLAGSRGSGAARLRTSTSGPTSRVSCDVRPCRGPRTLVGLRSERQRASRNPGDAEAASSRRVSRLRRCAPSHLDQRARDTLVEERAPASVSKPGDAGCLGSPGLEAQALRAFAPRPAGRRTGG